MREFLSLRGVELTEREFFAQPFSEEELRSLLDGCSPRKVLASKSPSVKKLNLDFEKLGDQEMVSLMIQEPRLIRRPLVKIGKRLLAGGDLRALAEALES